MEHVRDLVDSGRGASVIGGHTVEGDGKNLATTAWGRERAFVEGGRNSESSLEAGCGGAPYITRAQAACSARVYGKAPPPLRTK
jgi:hypothetical protein